MRVKACNATTQWLGLDAHEFLSPDQKFKRESELLSRFIYEG